ncbi:MAG: hypothetical protein CMC08_01050 [Flavobacteriaceae bacterium]|nr:hypothetical protein [Flavobacteriaceae bacterium]
MKYAWVFLLAVTLASCSTGDDRIATAEDFLVGNWYWQDELVNGKLIPYASHEACGKDYIIFSEDNSFAEMDVISCEERQQMVGEWEVEGATLTISAYGFSESAKVLELTETQLHVQIRFDYDGDGRNDTVIQRFTKK